MVKITLYAGDKSAVRNATPTWLPAYQCRWPHEFNLVRELHAGCRFLCARPARSNLGIAVCKVVSLLVTVNREFLTSIV